MEKYMRKAEVLSKYFGVYGKGNFDLSLEEIARILELLVIKKNDQYLDANLKELYDRLAQTRLG